MFLVSSIYIVLLYVLIICIFIIMYLNYFICMCESIRKNVLGFCDFYAMSMLAPTSPHHLKICRAWYASMPGMHLLQISLLIF